jgi:hypothetical protein
LWRRILSIPAFSAPSLFRRHRQGSPS